MVCLGWLPCPPACSGRPPCWLAGIMLVRTASQLLLLALALCGHHTGQHLPLWAAAAAALRAEDRVQALVDAAQEASSKQAGGDGGAGGAGGSAPFRGQRSSGSYEMERGVFDHLRMPETGEYLIETKVREAFRRGVAAMKRNELSKARRLFKKVLRQDPTLVDPRVNLGCAPFIICLPPRPTSHSPLGSTLPHGLLLSRYRSGWCRCA